MKKSFIKKFSNFAIVTFILGLFLYLSGCSNAIDVRDTTEAVESNSRLAVSEEKKEELALYALSGQYIASESELEGSVKAFLSKSVYLQSHSLSSNSEISIAKMDSIKISNNETNVARVVTEDFSEKIPVYYYEIINGEKTDVVIATPDRRIGNILAYIEDSTVENLADDSDSPGNWGWDGSRHGFYLSGVFDSRAYPLYTSSTDTSTRRSASTWRRK